jgi:hypothetical protein
MMAGKIGSVAAVITIQMTARVKIRQYDLP